MLIIVVETDLEYPCRIPNATAVKRHKCLTGIIYAFLPRIRMDAGFFLQGRDINNFARVLIDNLLFNFGQTPLISWVKE